MFVPTKKFTASFVFFTLIFCGLAQAEHQHSTDRPAVHGMLLFGSDHIYLSHLPMFHPPHDYQVILQVGLSNAAKNSYLNAKKQHPEISIFTIVPEPFVLPDKIAPNKQFSAQIFLGHFERGGVPISGSVPVTIEKVLFFKKFNAAEIAPNEAKYLAFGAGSEIFAAHLISVKPDFDHIMHIAPHAELAQLLQKSQILELTIPIAEKLQPIPANAKLSPTLNGNPIAEFQTGAEIYLEFGDLAD